VARVHTNLKTEVWAPGSGFRQLSPHAQWAYMLLMSQSQISNLGLLAYTPQKWVRLAKGLTEETLEEAIAELAAGYYILVDRDTSELLVRTFIRHDKVWSQPALVTNARVLIGQVESDEIREHLLARHPWLDGDTWLQDAPEFSNPKERWREWDGPRIADYESHTAQTKDPSRDSSQDPSLKSAHPPQGQGARGVGLGEQQQDQKKTHKPRPHAAAELESPRDPTIAAAADRYAADLPVVEAEARQLPALLFDDVVERVNARCNTGTIGNPAGLLVDLLRRARREAAKREIRETEPRSLMQIAVDDAKSYARGDHPWDVAHELLTRKLKRLGAENGTSEALLDAAHAAYRTEFARAQTP
jgi:hypothetical protein